MWSLHKPFFYSISVCDHLEAYKKTNLHKVMQLHIYNIWDSMCSCSHSSYINFSMRVEDVSVVLYMPVVHPYK